MQPKAIGVCAVLDRDRAIRMRVLGKPHTGKSAVYVQTGLAEMRTRSAFFERSDRSAALYVVEIVALTKRRSADGDEFLSFASDGFVEVSIYGRLAGYLDDSCFHAISRLCSSQNLSPMRL